MVINSKKSLISLLLLVLLTGLVLIACAEQVSVPVSPSATRSASSPVFTQAVSPPGSATASNTAEPISPTPAQTVTPVGQIVSTAPMSSSRASHTATLLPSGKVLIAGGFEREGVFLASTELFDPLANKFTPAQTMNQSRISHTATLLPGGKVLIVGGLSGRSATNSAELYDPGSGQFQLTGNLGEARTDHTATLLLDGKVLVVGGTTTGTQAGTLATAEIYDPATGQFQPTGSLSSGLTSHASTLLPGGKVLITGGATAPHQLFAGAELYDPATSRFSPTGRLNFLRYKHTTTLLPDGEVLILGGADERDWQGLRLPVELYNPSRAAFVSGADLLSGHFKIPTGAILLASGKVLVAGGSRQVELYDPATRRFSSVAGSLSDSFYFPTATRLDDGRVLLVGGYSNGQRGPVCTPNAWLYQS